MRSLIQSHPRRLAPALLLATMCAATGCANLKSAEHDQQSDCPKNTNAETEHKKMPNVGEQRRILNEGYSLLYRDASHLDLSKLILYAKSESKPMKDAVTDVAGFGGKLKKDLEKIAKDYPAVSVDLDPLPEMEKRKRFDIGKDRIIDFAPGVGISGREYERTVLIAMLNGINHERHMCKVMADEEPDAGLKKFLLDTQKGYDVYYDRVDALLKKDYFK